MMNLTISIVLSSTKRVQRLKLRLLPLLLSKMIHLKEVLRWKPAWKISTLQSLPSKNLEMSSDI
jgi:hypothetical protein